MGSHHFQDTLLGIKESAGDEPLPPEPSVLGNYRKRVEYYLKQHDDIPAVQKLRNNEPL